jgi:hypothetical protein
LLSSRAIPALSPRRRVCANTRRRREPVHLHKVASLYPVAYVLQDFLTRSSCCTRRPCCAAPRRGRPTTCRPTCAIPGRSWTGRRPCWTSASR